VHDRAGLKRLRGGWSLQPRRNSSVAFALTALGEVSTRNSPVIMSAFLTEGGPREVKLRGRRVLGGFLATLDNPDEMNCAH
jgi:hypothetical protein